MSQNDVYYKALYEVAADINSAHESEDVLHLVTKNVTRVMNAKGCSLILLSADKKNLLHTVTDGLSDAYIDKGNLSTDKSIAEVMQGKAVAIINAATDPRVQYSEATKTEGIVSILSVPMMLRGEMIGVIRVYTAERRDFNDDDIHFVQAIANLGAIALENSQLYESLQKSYDQLRQEMLEWRTAMSITGEPRSMWFMRHSNDRLPGKSN